jgi:hypothetical protein
MFTLILFREWDPWYRPDASGFNKVGYIANDGTVIFPRRGRVARRPLSALLKKPHQLMRNDNFPRAQAANTFFTCNIINMAMFNLAMKLLSVPDSPFWDDPIKMPILRPITPEEHKLLWDELKPALELGDTIFTLNTKNPISRLIAYLDQGSWSHLGIYTGNGRIFESIPSGTVERSIEVYRDPRYRLGIYRDELTAQQKEVMPTVTRSMVGGGYDFGAALRLGLRMALRFRPSEDRRNVTPNMRVLLTELKLIKVI